MGTFRVDVEVASAFAPDKTVTVSAIVDSGAAYSSVPAGILSGLGVCPDFKRMFKLANGALVERDVGEARVRLRNESITRLVVFGDAESEPLLGADILEGFGLGIDPVNKALVPVTQFLL